LQMFAAHGLIQAKQYSWKRSADLTVAALERFQKGQIRTRCQSLDELRAVRLNQVREVFRSTLTFAVGL
jgi:hypothetical protein